MGRRRAEREGPACLHIALCRVCAIWADTKAFQATPKVGATHDPKTVLDTCMQTKKLDPASTVRMGPESVPGDAHDATVLNNPVELLRGGKLKVGAQCVEVSDDLDQYLAAQYDHLENYVDCGNAA